MRSQMIRKRAIELDPKREWPTDQTLEETDLPGFRSVAPQKPAVSKDASEEKTAFIPKFPRCRKCNANLGANKSEFYCDNCNMPLKKYAGPEQAVMDISKDASEEKTADMMGDMVQKAVAWLRQHRKDPNVVLEAKSQMPLGNRVPEQVIQEFVRTGDESTLISKISPAAKPWEGRQSMASAKSKLLTEDKPDENFEEPKRPEPDTKVVEESADNVKKDIGKSRSVKLDQHEAPKGTPSAWAVDNEREQWHKANKKKGSTPSAWAIDNTREMPDEEPELTTEEQINLKKKEGSRKNALLSSLTTAFATAWKGANPEEKKQMARDLGKSYEEMDTFAHEWTQGSVAPEEAGAYLGVSPIQNNTHLGKLAAGGAEEEELQVDEPETGVDGTVVQLLEACKTEWHGLGDPVNPETWPKEIERAILSLNDDLVAAIQKTEDKLVEGEFYSKNVDEGVEGHGGSMLGDLNIAQPEEGNNELPVDGNNELPPADNNEGLVDMNEEVEKLSSKKTAASLPDVSSTETRKALKHVQGLKDKIANEFFEFKKNVQIANDSSIVKNIGEILVGLKVRLEDVEKILGKQLQVLEDAEEQAKVKEKKAGGPFMKMRPDQIKDIAYPKEWGCGSCKGVNLATAYSCKNCGAPKPASKAAAAKTAACPTCGAQVLQNGKDTQGIPCPNCAKKPAPNPSAAPNPPGQPSGAVPTPAPKPSTVPQTGPVKHYGGKKLSLINLVLAGEE